MSRYTQDIDAHKAKQRYFTETEQGIRVANQEVIHGKIPQLDQERAFAFAVTVARLRAEYLEAALDLCGKAGSELPDAAAMDGLRQKREIFEEARAAYDALSHAIDVGYIDIGRIITSADK
ncbi:MAG: hypothetical protein P8Z76_11365 [Alphaproteobacteria bacterium]|jgi:hypothetical protein